jgi:hypothetical protein
MDVQPRESPFPFLPITTTTPPTLDSSLPDLVMRTTPQFLSIIREVKKITTTFALNYN